MKFCVFFVFLTYYIFCSEPSRSISIDKIRLAFEQQSIARSYQDSYNCAVLFNCAKSELEKQQEPKDRIKAIQDLWIWYRRFGYSCGLIRNPVQCPDEYIPGRNSHFFMNGTGASTCDKKLDPNQERWMRDFLLGVGQTISGVFCITVNPPIGGKFGTTLIMSGFGFMWNSVNNMVVDRQQKDARLAELEVIRDQAQKTIQTN